MISRAQTFTLLACLTLVALIGLAPALGSAPVAATTAAPPGKILSSPAVRVESGAWARERFEQQTVPVLAESTRHTEASFMHPSSARPPSPVSIHEGQSQERFLIRMPLSPFGGDPVQDRDVAS